MAYARLEGSNNWVVSGRHTATGKPLLANDPHRTISLPSLRYLSHLVGPGWDVIGAGEPAVPGVAAGHNQRIGFGFTIVGMDQQDVYVEQVRACPGGAGLGLGAWGVGWGAQAPSPNPQPRCFFYRGAWKPIRTWISVLYLRLSSKP